MSGLAAILHSGVAPASGDLDRMLTASAHRGPHGRSCWTEEGGIALGYLSFETVPESESQPIVDRARRAAIVFDGRLDNRAELSRTLGVGDRAAPDARIAIEAFIRWGAEAPSRMLGDFAWAAWDGSRRRLVAARDHMGIRPLHYFAGAHEIICATDIAQLLAHPSVRREPDVAAVAAYLSLDVPNSSSTLFRGIRRIPPGHCLVVEGGTATLHEYWQPAPRAPIRLRDDGEYAAQCREIFTRSVACRLRSRRPVTALLSGGVDSSSVVAVASRLLDGRAGGLAPFSLVFPGRVEADERSFIEDVAARCRVAPVFVEPARVTADAMRRHAEETLDCPGFASDFGARTLYEAIHGRGHEVTLTGAGGDFLFGGSVFQYADFLRELRVAAALRQFVADWRTDSTGWSRLGLIRAGLWPLMPPRVKRRLRPLARRVAGVPKRIAWLRLRREPPPVQDSPRGGSFATEDVTRALGSGMHSLFLEAGERVAARVPIEARHPFLDVRLIDFALSIPDTQRRRGPILKYVLRNALGGELPESVATRRTKAEFGYVIVEALESLGGASFFSTLAIAEAGWVDGHAIATVYDRMRRRFAAADARYSVDVPWLWIVAAVELWFDAVFGAASRVTPAPAHAMM